jgi:hypothetical protein
MAKMLCAAGFRKLFRKAFGIPQLTLMFAVKQKAAQRQGRAALIMMPSL